MASDEEIKLVEELAGPVYWQKARDDFMLFADGLLLPNDQLFCECMADFQRDTFKALEPTLYAIRDRRVAACRRFWIERTKKSGKDSDVAVVILWLMAFARRSMRCQVVAGDFKQATVLRNRCIELVEKNPWLHRFVEIIENQVRNKDGRRNVVTQFEASNTSGAAHGEAPDVLVLNEITHAETRWRAVHDHLQNASGVPHGVVLCVTNAGIKGTKPHVMRRAAVKGRITADNPGGRWWVGILGEDGDYLPRVRADWIDADDIEEARKMDPVGAEFNRLWQGRWISGTGGAISEADLERAFRLPGPTPGREPGWRYMAGLDLGETHDHAGMVVVAVNQDENRIKVVRIGGWAPSVPMEGGLVVPIDDVKAACIKAHNDYGIEWFGYDPAAGGRFCAYDLLKRGLPMHKCSFSGMRGPTEMATSLIQSMREGVLELYDDEDGRLRRDIAKFDIENRGLGGYRLRATSDEHGHADVGTALVIILPRAMECMGSFGRWSSAEGDVSDEPLSQHEVDEMPEALRDIYDYGMERDGW